MKNMIGTIRRDILMSLQVKTFGTVIIDHTVGSSYFHLMTLLYRKFAVVSKGWVKKRLWHSTMSILMNSYLFPSFLYCSLIFCFPLTTFFFMHPFSLLFSMVARDCNWLLTWRNFSIIYRIKVWGIKVISSSSWSLEI